MSTEITEVVDLPGKFCGWFDGTGLMQSGPDAGDVTAKLLHDAYNAARVIKRGKGYTARVTITGHRTVVMSALAYLADFGDYCRDANSDGAYDSTLDASDRNSYYSEMKAGEKVHEKLTARVRELEKEVSA